MRLPWFMDFGGAVPHQPLGIGDAESYYAQEPAAPPSPESLYDRAWAITVLRRTLAILTGLS